MAVTSESLDRLPRPFGPFTLLRLIAQGGMGQVFLALREVESEPVDEVCVVKTVRSDLRDDKEAVGRFLDEARVVQRLDHKNICHTLDAGVFDHTYFLALEFISGRNLRDVQTRATKAGRRLPEALIFDAVTGVLQALGYAHALRDTKTNAPLGIVHRDVSPHNVMVGFDGAVKLIDFGLASHTLKQELTRPGVMVGKLRYNAPEQVRDRALDGRSDVYSVGVMLYELVTGERFYEGLTEEGVWRAAMKGTHRPPSYGSVARDLRQILDSALAPMPQDRFATAVAMQSAVRGLARSRGVIEDDPAVAEFISSLFLDERRAEHEMIVQATGLADARTQAPRGVPAKKQRPVDSDVSAIGRTAIISPAEVRGKLAELVSGFDPNALTIGHAPPQIRALRAGLADDDDGLTTGSGSANAFAPIGPVSALGTERTSTQQQPTVAARPRFNAAADAKGHDARRQQDQDALGKTVVLAASDVPASWRQGASERSGAVAAEREPTALRWAAGLSAAAVAVVVAAVVGLPAFRPEAQAPDAGQAPASPDDVAVPAPLPLPQAPVAPPGPRIVELTLPAAPAAPPPVSTPVRDPPRHGRRDDAQPRQPRDASAAKDAGTDVEPMPDGSLEAAEHERAVREAREAQARPKPPRKPPARDLVTWKDKVDYLSAYCLDRVACARPVTKAAAQLVTLSPAQTKQLQAELPACIAKCRE